MQKKKNIMNRNEMKCSFSCLLFLLCIHFFFVLAVQRCALSNNTHLNDWQFLYVSWTLWLLYKWQYHDKMTKPSSHYILDSTVLHAYHYYTVLIRVKSILRAHRREQRMRLLEHAFSRWKNSYRLHCNEYNTCGIK